MMNQLTQPGLALVLAATVVTWLHPLNSEKALRRIPGTPFRINGYIRDRFLRINGYSTYK